MGLSSLPMRAPLLLVALGLALSVPASAQGDAPVRVRLLSAAGPSDVTVSAAAPLAVRVDGREVRTADGPIQLRVSGSEVEVSGSGLRERGRSVEIEGGPVRLRAGRTDRTYHGSLSASADGRALRLVNEVPMTDYVASVVASEYPFSEIEGVKAQAVLARTYALRRRDASADYDVEDDQRSQVYRGIGQETARSRQAAEETAGEVLIYRDGLAEAVYSSSSGGHTADNESVWEGAPVPYLRGVPDPYDADAPDHAWQTTADRDALHRALSRRYGGRVQDVQVDRQSREGRVISVRLVGANQATVSGSEFREVANAAVGARTVRSTQFQIRSDGRRYVFDGRGFGHGVGMSQYGARGQARAGRSYREILGYYFQGTSVGVTTAAGPAPMVASTRPAFQAREDDPVVRGSTEARRWPTPRRDARPASDRQDDRPTPRRKGW